MSRIIKTLDVAPDVQTVALPLGAQFLPTMSWQADGRVNLYVLCDMSLKIGWRHIVMVEVDVDIDRLLEKGARYVTSLPADATHGSLHLFDLGT